MCSQPVSSPHPLHAPTVAPPPSFDSPAIALLTSFPRLRAWHLPPFHLVPAAQLAATPAAAATCIPTAANLALCPPPCMLACVLHCKMAQLDGSKWCNLDGQAAAAWLEWGFQPLALTPTSHPRPPEVPETPGCQTCPPPSCQRQPAAAPASPSLWAATARGSLCMGIAEGGAGLQAVTKGGAWMKRGRVERRTLGQWTAPSKPSVSSVQGVGGRAGGRAGT